MNPPPQGDLSYKKYFFFCCKKNIFLSINKNKKKIFYFYFVFLRRKPSKQKLVSTEFPSSKSGSRMSARFCKKRGRTPECFFLQKNAKKIVFFRFFFFFVGGLC